MSREQNEIAVRRYLEEVWNQGKVDVVDELFVPEIGAGLKERVKAFLIAFPDWHCVIDDLFVEDDKVVNRWTAAATQTGPLFGIPPTGKRVTVEGITIHHLKDGRIVNDWSQADQLGLMQQLGVVPAWGG